MSNHSLPDKVLLTRIKLGLFAFLVISLLHIPISRFEADGDIWPLQVWTMYSRPRSTFTEYTTYQLRFVDVDGVVTRMRPFDVRILHRTVPQQNFVIEVYMRDAVFHADPAVRAEYADYLVRTLPRLFPQLHMVEIQIWQVTWAVDSTQYPPYDYDHPDQETLLLSLPVELTTEAAWSGR